MKISGFNKCYKELKTLNKCEGKKHIEVWLDTDTNSLITIVQPNDIWMPIAPTMGSTLVYDYEASVSKKELKRQVKICL